MQVTTTQAARALDALRSSRRRGAARRRRQVRPARRVPPTTLDRALAEIAALPTVRPERVAEARGRVDRGERPSAAEVADMLVRRTLCDRLR